jgi:hypothetical protein
MKESLRSRDFGNGESDEDGWKLEMKEEMEE